MFPSFVPLSTGTSLEVEERLTRGAVGAMISPDSPGYQWDIHWVVPLPSGGK